MSLEQRVRSTLKEAGSRIDTMQEPSPEVAQPTSSRPRPRPRPMLAFVATFAGVLLLGAVALLVSRDGVREVTSDEVLPLDPAQVGMLRWTSVNALPADYTVLGMAKGPDGWLALASRFINSMGGEHLILRSDDGVEWSRVEGASLPGAVHATQIIGSEDGYMVHGLYAGEAYSVTTVNRPSNFAEPGVWASVDGTNWQLTPLPLPSPEQAISEIVSYRVFHLAVAGGRAVALGTEFDEDLPEIEGSVIVPTRPLMWESDQPGHWRLIQSDQLKDWSGLAVGPTGIVAAGPSDAGISIERLDEGGWVELATVAGQGLFRADLAGNHYGYLVQTSNGAYFSADAINWTAVEGPTRVFATSAHEAGFTIIGGSGNTPAVWWSQDGTTWATLGSNDNRGLELEGVNGAVVTEKSVALFGQTRGSGGLFDITGAEGFLRIGTIPR